MIIQRYLTREVIAATAAIGVVLMVIIVSVRFTNYLGDAAAGEIDPAVLSSLFFYRMPGFVQLVLPLALFIGVLLAYGRMYIDSEMVVLFSVGVNNRQLITMTFPAVMMVMALVFWVAFYLGPDGQRKFDAILTEQHTRTELEALMPDRFQPMFGNRGVIYAAKIENNVAEDLFVTKASSADPRKTTIIVAATGRKATRDGHQYIELSDGVRYTGIPGTAEYDVTRFNTFSQLSKQRDHSDTLENDAIATRDLWGSADIAHRATLQWRISLVVLVPIVFLLAVSLSRTNPRQGRYMKMFPAIILYFVYLVLLGVARTKITKGKLSPELGMWWIHAVFLGLGVALLRAEHWSWPHWLHRKAK